MQRVSRRSEIQGQTRQHSKLINLPRKKQISVEINKVDCDTAYKKQERVEQDGELDGAPKTRRDVGVNVSNA